MSTLPVARFARPRPVAFVISILIAWLLLALVAIGLRRGPIEADLTSRATAVVRKQTGASATVTFDGRNAVLHGTFPSTQAAEMARSSVAEVDGASSARLGDDVRIASKPARPLVVAVEGKDLLVTATVPDRNAREDLLGAAVAASDGNLTSEVVVDGDVASPPVTVFPEIAAALTASPGDHGVQVRDDTVVLSGTVPDPTTLGKLGDDVLAAAREAMPEVKLDNQLTVGTSESGGGGAALRGRGDYGGHSSVAERLAAAMDGGTITFRTGSLTMTAEDEALLDRVAAVLASGEATVLVEGYSDASGPMALNQILSAERARVVVAYLAAHGVPQEKLRAAGFGPGEPAQPNDTSDGRAANRRVEIVLSP
jgi:outer membrane protein OmpA-like peptidoglycan-associated protein